MDSIESGLKRPSVMIRMPRLLFTFGGSGLSSCEGWARNFEMCNKSDTKHRRLIVDTDLGLDDLVALAILRVQQCLVDSRGGGDGNGDQPPLFYVAGVTLTSGISLANAENAQMLRRILPPNTPVYVSGGNYIDTSSSSSSSSSSLSTPSHRDIANVNKPIWWSRTANRVLSFLSSLPQPHASPFCSANDEMNTTISAEQFIASNMDDSNVDFLCLAPLSTVARALLLRSSSVSTRTSAPKASFYIMGGIQSDSRVTKRGESTAPFGYNDPKRPDKQEISKEYDNFGEFNFALDIHAARTVLSAVPNVRLIPLESCTLIPESLRSNTENNSMTSLSLSCILKDIPPNDCDSSLDLHIARNNLRMLFREFGTIETQWDSIAAAIYCNAFDNNVSTPGSVDCVSTKIGLCKRLDSREMKISDLGEITCTGQQVDDEIPSAFLWVYPNFTLEDETNFMRYLEILLNS